MGKEGAVEIQSVAVLFGPVYPFAEILRRNFFAGGSAGLAVHGMQIDLRLNGRIGKRLVNIGAHFLAVARAAGIITRNQILRNGVCILKAHYVVSLPVMQRNRNLLKIRNSLFGIHAISRKGFLCGFISAQHLFVISFNHISSLLIIIISNAVSILEALRPFAFYACKKGRQRGGMGGNALYIKAVR